MQRLLLPNLRPRLLHEQQESLVTDRPQSLLGQKMTIRLKSGQISPLGLAALAIGILSPALALFALWGPMQAAAGPITPLVFLGAAALTLPTAISYAVLNQEAPSAGAASTWVWRAVSPA